MALSIKCLNTKCLTGKQKQLERGYSEQGERFKQLDQNGGDEPQR